jgi:hypothetical protein
LLSAGGSQRSASDYEAERSMMTCRQLLLFPAVENRLRQKETN